MINAKLEPAFTFAGFTFPRYIASLPKGTPASRKGEKRYCGDYYHAPMPVERRKDKGFSGYMSMQGDINGLRCVWADEVEGSYIDHKGWFADDYCEDKFRGVVIRLPHGRYLAGWSMGEGMCCSIDADIYDDEQEAADAADSLAEDAADNERDYRENEEAEAEEFRASIDDVCGTLEALGERIAERMSAQALA